MRQSEPLSPAGCGDHLEAEAARRELTESSDAVEVQDSPAAADDGAGCAASVAGDADNATTITPPATVREFERAMRKLGFSRAQAEGIARHGFKAAHGLPADGDESTVSAAADDGQAQALAQLAAALKGHK